MPIITFKGEIDSASGAVIFMTISGPNHFTFSKKYPDDFSEPLNLSSGDYNISMTVNTDGDFSFDVLGQFTSIDPAVPDDYAAKSSEEYTLTV